MDLLLDVNVIVDHCINREPFVRDVNLAMAKCVEEGGRLWVYVGSVQTIEYVTDKALKRKYEDKGRLTTAKQIRKKVRERLGKFISDKHWLAALASEGNVFNALDPEDEQLIRAMDRCAPGAIKLLTRDEPLLKAHPDKTISPSDLCQLKAESQPLPFIDLKTQQDAIRPQL